MTINDLENGLYLIKQKGGKFGVDHYAVLCVGNVLQIRSANNAAYIVHQTPPAIRMDLFEGTGDWEIIGGVAPNHFDEAKRRLIESLNDKDYRLFTNNCEQFARYLTEGKKYSTQIHGAILITAAIGIIALVDQE